jgi:hypothetical protein
MEGAWSFAGWYCRSGDTLSGPFLPEQIKRLMKSRRLRPSDRVWERWEYGRQALLFPALASTASADSSPPQPRRQSRSDSCRAGRGRVAIAAVGPAAR